MHPLIYVKVHVNMLYNVMIKLKKLERFNTNDDE